MQSKKRSKIFVLLSASLFITTATSCAIPIRDQEWCADMAQDGASCFHTLTTGSRVLTKQEWDDIRVGQLCTSPTTFADIKATVEKLCHASKNCVYEKALQAFFQQVEDHSRLRAALK